MNHCTHYSFLELLSLLPDSQLLPCSVDGNEANRFSIDPVTGNIYAVPLNREDQERYTLTIQAADHGVPSRKNQTRVIITVRSVHTINAMKVHFFSLLNTAYKFFLVRHKKEIL